VRNGSCVLQLRIDEQIDHSMHTPCMPMVHPHPSTPTHSHPCLMQVPAPMCTTTTRRTRKNKASLCRVGGQNKSLSLHQTLDQYVDSLDGKKSVMYIEISNKRPGTPASFRVPMYRPHARQHGAAELLKAAPCCAGEVPHAQCGVLSPPTDSESAIERH
jgi:hypothetical protein